MKNIVIFGGAFDPIHFGHLNMAINASKTLNAEVFFVPARISVWKEETAPVEDKINMIDLAIKSINAGERLKISRFEADSNSDVNYTIDTVRHFASKYPGSKLYLLIGTDQVNLFQKWKEALEISKLAQIVYFERPGMVLSKDNADKFNMLSIGGDIIDASSTEIRLLKSIETPLDVLMYILNHDLYFASRVHDFLDAERYKHSVSVAKLSYEIALNNQKEDLASYFIAALLHDIGKNVPILEQKEIVERDFAAYKDVNPKIYHQFTGRVLAEKEFGILDKDILDAIEFHTTGKPGMTDLQKVVYCADKIEPTRGFDSKELISAIMNDISKGFLTILEANKKFFQDHKIDFENDLTKQCMDYYLK